MNKFESAPDERAITNDKELMKFVERLNELSPQLQDLAQQARKFHPADSAGLRRYVPARKVVRDINASAGLLSILLD